MTKKRIWVTAYNLGILLIVALPAFFGFLWIDGLLAKSPAAHSVTESGAIGLFYYLVYFGPVLLGGIAHQLLVLVIPTSRSLAWRRIEFALLSLAIPAVVIALSRPSPVLAHRVLSCVGALIIYSLLARVPP